MGIVTRVESLIQSIREKPESTRWAILAAVTMILSALLLVFWVWNISRQLSLIQNPASGESEESRVIPSSFSASVKSMVDSFNAFRNGEDPQKIIEDIKKKNEEGNKPELSAPSLFSYFVSGAVSVMRSNIAAIGTAFRNIVTGRF